MTSGQLGSCNANTMKKYSYREIFLSVSHLIDGVLPLADVVCWSQKNVFDINSSSVPQNEVPNLYMIICKNS